MHHTKHLLTSSTNQITRNGDLTNNEASKPKLKFTTSTIPNIYGEFEQTDVLVWRFPLNLSQSHLGGRLIPSYACAPIAVSFAEQLEHEIAEIKLPRRFGSPVFNRSLQPSSIVTESTISSFSCFDRAVAGDRALIESCISAENLHQSNASKNGKELSLLCPPELTMAAVYAIMDGNERHEQACKTRPETSSLNFTIPEAIRATGNMFEEVDYKTVDGEFVDMLQRLLWVAIEHQSLLHLPRLYFIVIAYKKAILLAVDRPSQSLLFFDSHMHSLGFRGLHGSIVAHCSLDHVPQLAVWMSHCVFPEVHFSQADGRLGRSAQTDRMEISLIHYIGNPVRQGFTEVTSSPTKQRIFDVNSGGKDSDAPVIDTEKVEGAEEHASLQEHKKKRKRIARSICHIC